MRQFLKHSFNPRKQIRVIFHGKEAVDGGGPCREYFRLLCSSIREQSGVFFTKERLVNFRANVALFQEHRSYLVGLMIATSIIHGGLAFPFFPRVIYDYIALGKTAVDSNAGDVANPSTLHIIKMVSFFKYLIIFRHYIIATAYQHKE